MLLDAGLRPLPVAIAIALAVTLATSAVFAVLALRATGIGFVMITLALGQIVWGLAYRWISLTNGDNGINVAVTAGAVRPLAGSAGAFYYATLVVFLLAVVADGGLRRARRSAPACAARATSRGA